METIPSRESISRLIRKIQNDWERANKEDAGFSRIDKDILMDDLKKVYDIVYELEVKKVFRDSPIMERPSPEGSKTEDKTLPKQPDGFVDRPEETSDEIKDSASANIDETVNEVQETLQQNYEVGEDPFHQPPVELEIVGTGEKQPEQKPKAEKVHQQPPLAQKARVKPQQEKRVTLDLFSATKTLADVYQNDKDHSLSAKIKNDKISDIKTVIGINDKFLFINDIFKGEMTAYNNTIEKLNLTTNFPEALQIIDGLKLTTGTEENRPTFNKLLEIVKRRFH